MSNEPKRKSAHQLFCAPPPKKKQENQRCTLTLVYVARELYPIVLRNARSLPQGAECALGKQFKRV